jgi:hypothetical protein
LLSAFGTAKLPIGSLYRCDEAFQVGELDRLLTLEPEMAHASGMTDELSRAYSAKVRRWHCWMGEWMVPAGKGQ